jgi:hypothetical protein
MVFQLNLKGKIEAENLINSCLCVMINAGGKTSERLCNGLYSGRIYLCHSSNTYG